VEGNTAGKGKEPSRRTAFKKGSSLHTRPRGPMSMGFGKGPKEKFQEGNASPTRRAAPKQPPPPDPERAYFEELYINSKRTKRYRDLGGKGGGSTYQGGRY